MRICYIADARSPIACNWINYFVEQNHEVHVISSYPCETSLLKVASLHVVPIAFSNFSRVRHDGSIGKDTNDQLTFLKPLLANLRTGRLVQIASNIRNWLAPLDLVRHIRRVQTLIQSVQPDLVHAMRIPFEGILASRAVRQRPLLISVWGNDFTLFASRYPMISWLTRQALHHATAIHADCHRDMRLAHQFGFSSKKPNVVLPGAGGVQKYLFYAAKESSVRQKLGIAEDTFVVFNPRGFRGYVRNDTFFKSIPKVLASEPNVIFLSAAMEGNSVAEKWLQNLEIEYAVKLLPSIPRHQMAELFRLADVMVSPSEHDGTPNSLLEGMACGSFPIAGDIESVREWITNGVNGLLCDPSDPESLAAAILTALEDVALRKQTVEYNLGLIDQRAEYNKVMAQAEQFYYQVIEYAASNEKI